MPGLIFPHLIEDESQLDAILASPNDALVDFMRTLDGDLLILGVAGKIGVSLAQLAVTAIQKAGGKNKVYGVARFSDPAKRQQLDSAGVETIRCDLLDRKSVSELPQTRNVVFMAGRKFGTADAKSLTWAMNTMVPANVADHFRSSRIVAFSTGCVYPLVRVENTPDEIVEPKPIGEYANHVFGASECLSTTAIRTGHRSVFFG